MKKKNYAYSASLPLSKYPFLNGMGSVLDLSGSSDSLDWILNDEEMIGKWLGKVYGMLFHKQRLYIKTNLHMVKEKVVFQKSKNWEFYKGYSSR